MNEVAERHFWSSFPLTALRYNDARARDSHQIHLAVTTQVKSPVSRKKVPQVDGRVIREKPSALK